MRVFFVIIVVFTCFASIAQQAKPYTDFDKGYYQFYYQKWDSAYFYFDRFLQVAKDPVERAKTYSYIGEIQQNTGDLYGAQETLMDALRSLDPKVDSQRQQLAIIYTVVGNISIDLKRYDEAINYFNTALSYQPVSSDYGGEIINSKTIALQRKADFVNAIALYDSVLRTPQSHHIRLARLIHNRARTKWLQDKKYNPLAEYYTALKIRLDSNFTRGLIASYAHLADYYEHIDADSAFWYANNMYKAARQNQSVNDQLEAIDKLVQLNGDAGARLQWYNEFRRLDDSLGAARDTSRNRFALIRYEVEKNKIENLILQQHVTLQRLGIYALIALAVLITVAIWLRYRRHRKKIQQDSENTIRDARIKTSQKVHDVVANGLYNIMNELEHNQHLEREPLINKIEKLYESSRDISYEEDSIGGSNDYKKRILQMLDSFSSDRTLVSIKGDGEQIWNAMPASAQEELPLVLNELLVNMKRHSGAKNAVIEFKQQEDNFIVVYEDDDVGFKNMHQPGNGLTNTVSRIKGLQGEVIFGKSDKGGASISISFPSSTQPI